MPCCFSAATSNCQHAVHHLRTRERIIIIIIREKKTPVDPSAQIFREMKRFADANQLITWRINFEKDWKYIRTIFNGNRNETWLKNCRFNRRFETMETKASHVSFLYRHWMVNVSKLNLLLQGNHFYCRAMEHVRHRSVVTLECKSVAIYASPPSFERWMVDGTTGRLIRTCEFIIKLRTKDP